MDVAVEDQRAAVCVEHDLEHALLRTRQPGMRKCVLVRLESSHRLSSFHQRSQAASGNERPGGAQILEDAELPVPEAPDGDPHVRLVQQVRQRRQRPVLDLAPAEVQDHPAAISAWARSNTSRASSRRSSPRSNSSHRPSFSKRSMATQSSGVGSRSIPSSIGLWRRTADRCATAAPTANLSRSPRAASSPRGFVPDRNDTIARWNNTPTRTAATPSAVRLGCRSRWASPSRQLAE